NMACPMPLCPEPYTPANVIGVFRRSNAARIKKFGYQQLEELKNQKSQNY
ncbi:14039_t:CDS:1, partial [Dentiscutata erythropus]